jgi:hypothetical protein
MLAKVMPKKPRRKKVPKAPRTIDEITWRNIEAAICIGGLGYTECGRKFNVSPHAIMMRAKRHGWAVPSKIAKRVEALQKSVTERAVCERNRACNDKVVDTIAKSWAERGEAHRALAFDLAHKALREAARKGVAIESWRDADLADKVGRRNSGLDNEERSQIEVNLALVNARLEAINLPPGSLQEN